MVGAGEAAGDPLDNKHAASQHAAQECPTTTTMTPTPTHATQQAKTHSKQKQSEMEIDR